MAPYLIVSVIVFLIRNKKKFFNLHDGFILKYVLMYKLLH